MPPRESPFRILWLGAGLFFASLGFLGVFLPVLPSTPFFLLSAWALARGSTRLHRWLLSLPHVGGAIRDYELGLGIPRRTKILATVLIAVTIGITVTLGIENWALRLLAAILGTYGTYFIWRCVPTREDVLASPERTPTIAAGRPGIDPENDRHHGKTHGPDTPFRHPT